MEDKETSGVETIAEEMKRNIPMNWPEMSGMNEWMWTDVIPILLIGCYAPLHSDQGKCSHLY